MTARTPLRRRGRRGYTLVEVLLAMTVLLVGASGVMSMQKISMQSNLDARRADIANSIARMWMERIQKDAMSWTLPSASFPGMPSNSGNAALLGYANSNAGAWVLPTAYLPATSPYASISPGFDILGRDIPTTANLASANFCVNLRETWLVQNASNPTDSLLRVELRVVWPRGIDPSTYAPSLCTAALASTLNPSPTDYATLYMVTAVRPNGIQ